ncbi:hypothetical protein [Ancylobacter lacus]|uniref:hypothetical protein n=1 Tax=Ancylobacter lacus TaxID=2579970 RepID=UPI001BD12A15|nr:hypothetical protein [Ancylobacter lacus]MBS7538462.1 hypothetical protein [Ancylobacter lacus]
MDFDEEWLKDFISKRAKETWDQTQSPYHISAIAKEVHKEGVDYRKLISPLKLRQWLIKSDLPDAKIITDPTHIARVGIIPKNEDYNFEAKEKHPENSSSKKANDKNQTDNKNRKSEEVILDLLRALSKLDDSDLNNISIPINALVKIIRS